MAMAGAPAPMAAVASGDAGASNRGPATGRRASRAPTARGGVDWVRHAEGRPAVSSGAAIEYPDPTRAERRVDHALVAGAIERDDGEGRRAVPEVEFRTAEIAGPFLARRPHEFDRARETGVASLDHASENEHDREAAPVVADAGPDHTRSVVAHRETRAFGEYGV